MLKYHQGIFIQHHLFSYHHQLRAITLGFCFGGLAMGLRRWSSKMGAE